MAINLMGNPFLHQEIKKEENMTSNQEAVLLKDIKATSFVFL